MASVGNDHAEQPAVMESGLAESATRFTSIQRAWYFPTLDGWRAVAIVMVLWGHSIPTMRQTLGLKHNSSLSWFNGDAGVPLFFALSGFLICSRLLNEYNSAGGLFLRRFYIRRVHRILPAAWVALVVFGILGLSGVISIRLHDWLAAATFATNYITNVSRYLSHFWSLAMEEHFYLLFPLLLGMTGAKRALPITIALAIAVAFWRQIDTTFEITLGILPMPWIRTDAGCDGLLWGCVAAFFYQRWPGFIRDRLNGRALIVILVALAAIICWPVRSPSQAMVLFSLRAVLLPVLLLATVTHPQSVLARALEIAPVRWVGRISFSLYLWQELFLVDRGNASPILATVQTWPTNLICAFAAATLSYYAIEKPFIHEGYRRTASVELRTV